MTYLPQTVRSTATVFEAAERNRKPSPERVAELVAMVAQQAGGRKHPGRGDLGWYLALILLQLAIILLVNALEGP